MIYLIGASGHAKVILEILEIQGYRISGLLDNDPLIKTLLDYPVYQDIPESFNNETKIIIAIGNNKIRKNIVVNNSYIYMSAVHPKSTISSRSTIGSGSVIMPGVTINSGVKIGEHSIINTNSSIDHDCIIEDFVHVSPNVAMAGNVKVGEGTHIGIGASIIQGLTIGKWCVIGAGSVVIKDIPNGCTVVGNPGRIIKQLGV